tara:strand:- start:559 stop:1119 length:561 start_codon:yes stop_codon:yes gene_type:complete
MRVISGDLKGKKILPPINNNTRPLRDLVKESIFNLIEHSNKFDCFIKDSNILDLFSGTGSFGIECISRKAKKVTFVENHKDALLILKKNILLLKAQKKSKIIEKNCFNYFNFQNKIEEKFNLIFVDPPYKEEKINIIINTIKEKKILTQNGIFIIHRHKKDKIDITDNLKILDERTYGISKITIGG